MDSTTLRKKICSSTQNYCQIQNIKAKFVTPSGVTIFNKGKNFNDNFEKNTFKNICNNTEWYKRLDKKHSHFQKDENVAELDSCTSSDALLMNVFCSSQFDNDGMKKLLSVSSFQDIKFGIKAQVLKGENYDKTEIDMQIDKTYFEAKLTENDFQKKKKEVVSQYTRFEKVFDVGKLDQDDEDFFNYQLIRNILAIEQNDYNFVLLCDARRPDLVRNFIRTLICVKNIKLRKRCNFITWQEIAEACNSNLRNFLEIKYGL